MIDLLWRLRDLLDPVLRNLERPLYLIEDAAGFQANLFWLTLYDFVAIGVIVASLNKGASIVKSILFKDDLEVKADIDELLRNQDPGGAPVASAGDLKSMIGPVKKRKDWDRLAEIYEQLERPALAAKYFKKSGKPLKAAEQFAKAGKGATAAKIMMKEGDFEAAGQYFLAAGKFAPSAKAYLKQGNLAGAAHALAKGGKYPEAVAQFTEYFQSPRDSIEKQVLAAKNCFALLEDEKAKSVISDEDRKRLLVPVAGAHEHQKQYELAATLYRQAGELVRAGEAYVKAGKLQEAATCMKEAGQPKEAARIGGRFYEGLERWSEAGMAYAGAEEWARAGECFSRAKEPARAGECLAKAGAFAKAGLAYAHAGRYADAVGLLQRVPDDDGDFDTTRALLGRCFWELHDYPHCAATLENNLLGKRVDKSNIDYFYLLGMAQEQLGELGESRKVFLKIGAVNKGYGDLEQKISNIDSRISILKDQTGMSVIPGQAQAVKTSADMKVMGMVENSLGERYAFEKELGRGGMGVVYLARDRQLDRPVALKFLGSLVDSSDEYKKRFMREARTAAKINHPNIVAIYDISASEGKAFIAMEFVEGPNLFRYLESKGKLTPREAVNYMTQTCSALSAIHQAGIVHRDIKPENIVLAKGGLVKLMDFGLAKSEDNRMTKANTIMGTPPYMSPEQVRGKDVDGRSDIYAMGLVLHEMLTGNIVFGDGDILKRQVMEMPPKPSEGTEGISPKLDEIVMKCIEKDPAARYQTGKELVDDLRTLSFS